MTPAPTVPSLSERQTERLKPWMKGGGGGVDEASMGVSDAQDEEDKGIWG